jgi:hypothetical protein
MGLSQMPKFGAEVVLEGVDQFLSDIEKSQKGLDKLHDEFAAQPKVPQTGGGGLDATLTGLSTKVTALVTGLGTMFTVVSGGLTLLTLAGQAVRAQLLDPLAEWVVEFERAGLLVGMTGQQYATLVGVFETVGVKAAQVNSLIESSAKTAFAITDETLPRYVSYLAAIEDPAERAAVAIEMFGEAGAKAILPLTQNAEATLLQVEAMKEMNAAMTPEAIAAVDEYNTALAKFDISREKLGRGLQQTFGIALLPLATKFIDFLGRLAGAVSAIWDGRYANVPPFLRTLLDLSNTAAARDLAESLEGIEDFVGKEEFLQRQIELEGFIFERDAALAKQAEDEAKLAEQSAEKAIAEEKRKYAEMERERERAMAEMRAANTEFFNDVAMGFGRQFDQLEKYVQGLSLGGARQNILDEMLRSVIEGGVLTEAEAKELLNQWKPLGAIYEWAKETGFNAGDTLTAEMKKKLKDELLAAGLSEKEANATIKAFLGDPKAWIDEAQTAIQKLIEPAGLVEQTGQVARDTTDGIFRNLEEDIEIYTPAWMEFWVNPIKAAAAAAEEVIAKWGRTVATPAVPAHPGGPQEGTGPIVSGPASALGGPASGPTTNMNLTVNSSAPTEQVVSDFRMMQALAKSGRGFIQ